MNSPNAGDNSILEEAHSGTLLFTSLFNSCQDAIDFKTPDGVIRAWNPAAERLYGYSAKEIIGKHVSLLHGSEDSEIFFDKLRATIEGKLQSRFETMRITKSGEEIFVNLILSPVIDIDGRLLGLSAISRDVTQEKFLKRQRLRLEKDREELLSILANDVSNSLNQFDRLAQAFDLDSKADDPIKQMLKSLKCENRKFLSTLENLMLVYELEKARPLKFVSVDLESVIEKTKRTLLCSSPNTVNIETNLIAGKELIADFELVSRLFKILLSWSMTHAKEDSLVKVETVDNKDTNLIRIDTVYNAYQSLKYDKAQLFSSAWRTADGVETGGLSGLGLFLARRIAEAHGGSLNLNFEDNESVFSLELPQHQNESNKVLELNRDL